MKFRLLLISALALFSCDDSTERDSPQDEEKSLARPAPPVAKLSVEDPEARALVSHHRLQALVRSDKNSEELTRLLYGTPKERLWGSFGLGLHCRSTDPQKTLTALANASAAWVAEEAPPQASLLRNVGFAIGSCATAEAEQLLRSWLAPDPSSDIDPLIEAGAWGLTALADHGRGLEERTQTALLDAAAREKRGDLLFPLSRMARLSDAVGAHLLEVVGTILTQSNSEGRRAALLALGKAGPSAADPLAQVLLAKTFSPQERASAAHGLAALGAYGQRALDKTVGELLERGLPLSFDRELWIPLRAALEGLEEADKSRAVLSQLRSTVLSEGKEASKQAQRKRLIWLRCRAADLLAGTQSKSSALLQCDPKHGREQQLAQLRVLGRGSLEGERLKIFLSHTKSDDPKVAQAALRLLPSHPEVTESGRLLKNALSSEIPGTQAVAALIISAYPSRVLSDQAEGVPEPILAALKKLLAKDSSAPDETRAAALSAAGALRALSLKPFAEELCDGPTEAFHRPAAQALSLLGSPQRKCPKNPEPESLAEVAPVAPPATTLVIDSDVGELLLHLEPDDAPVAAAQFLRLVDQGFYNGLSVHGARPGYAVQFGDKDGDGYESSAHARLPHEVSPTPFGALSFGMGAFAPGAHWSQLFVLVSEAPQLLGTRIRLGRAEGPWHLLMVGDTFHSVNRR